MSYRDGRSGSWRDGGHRREWSRNMLLTLIRPRFTNLGEVWEKPELAFMREVEPVFYFLTVGNNVNSPIRTSAIGLLQHLQLLYLSSELDIDKQIQQVILYFYCI
jgi:hypothetical protein